MGFDLSVKSLFYGKSCFLEIGSVEDEPVHASMIEMLTLSKRS